MFTKIPFRVGYPLEVFHPTKMINFEDGAERADLFRRNIYYYLFEKERNNLLEKKHKTFLEVGGGVLDYLNSKYPKLEVLNLSLFGSSTVLENSGDYDFLAITQGDVFLLDEPSLTLNGKKVETGISIKGVENYVRGFNKKDDSVKNNQLEQIIDRTAISLFRRHIPLFGRDFINNEVEFQKNALAQVSDLVNNAYELFYLEREGKLIPKCRRAKKLLVRCYEATSYLGIIDSDERIQKFRREIYAALKNRYELEKSKRIFDRFGELYEKKTRALLLS
ncbi:MAG: hypothetical protein NTW06_02910 [Candidatus Falkowbacteria bacterium]|nr:hypothetical protein [Candidatus Falkowbacteria bacterium]